MTSAPAPINPADYPFLSGCFAPIADECDGRALDVVHGEIPPELNGIYMRNGGNPRFTPLGGFVYPFEGDAMVHAVELTNGTASYRNRFLRTPALELEEKAGHAIWASLMSGYQPDPEVVAPTSPTARRTCRASTSSATTAGSSLWPNSRAVTASPRTCALWRRRPSAVRFRWASARTRRSTR